jgi:hypothetical protein
MILVFLVRRKNGERESTFHLGFDSLVQMIIGEAQEAVSE